jgi:hypothetical protein
VGLDIKQNKKKEFTIFYIHAWMILEEEEEEEKIKCQITKNEIRLN